MKLPEYRLSKEVAHTDRNSQNDPIEFSAGTLISTVFWSEHNLPVHIREEMRDYLKFIPEKEKYVMCIIGPYWIPVHRSFIRKD